MTKKQRCHFCSDRAVKTRGRALYCRACFVRPIKVRRLPRHSSVRIQYEPEDRSLAGRLEAGFAMLADD